MGLFDEIAKFGTRRVGAILLAFLGLQDKKSRRITGTKVHQGFR